MKEELKIFDTKIPLPKAFIKFGKKEYMEKYVLEGELRFSPSLVFQNMPSENNDIADNHEGHLFYSFNDLYYARLLDEEKYIYDKPKLLAKVGQLKETNDFISKVPFHCLYAYDKPIINNLLKLDNYDDLISGLNDYDTAVIILNPSEYIKRINNINQSYINYVKYTSRTPLPSELTNQYHQLFYKRMKFNKQKEFRIVLPYLKIDEPINIQIGTLTDIAFIIPISYLKKGVVIADSKEKLKEIVDRLNQQKRSS